MYYLISFKFLFSSFVSPHTIWWLVGMTVGKICSKITTVHSHNPFPSYSYFLALLQMCILERVIYARWILTSTTILLNHWAAQRIRSLSAGAVNGVFSKLEYTTVPLDTTARNKALPLIRSIVFWCVILSVYRTENARAKCTTVISHKQIWTM